MKALVISGGQAKNAEQRTIASARMLETPMDQRSEIISRQFVSLEGLMHNSPEILSSNQPIPESVGGT